MLVTLNSCCACLKPYHNPVELLQALGDVMPARLCLLQSTGCVSCRCRLHMLAAVSAVYGCWHFVTVTRVTSQQHGVAHLHTS